MLKVQQLAFRFPGASTPLFENFSLELAAGEKVALTGPSGIGKTTLLYALAGLLPRQEGRVYLGSSEPLPPDDGAMSQIRNRSVGLVFQSYNLLNELTVAENLALRLAIAGRDGDRAQMSALLERVGLASFLDTRVGRLSGGQQQRVAAARALIAEPALVLADEPTGNLDDGSAKGVIDLLFESGYRAAVLIATHDQRVLARVDRIVPLTDFAGGAP